jgi:hypothetical protein
MQDYLKEPDTRQGSIDSGKLLMLLTAVGYYSCTTLRTPGIVVADIGSAPSNAPCRVTDLNLQVQLRKKLRVDGIFFSGNQRALGF